MKKNSHNNIKALKSKNFSLFTFHFSLSGGLTLVELLIVIAIISLLISGLVVVINPLQKIGQAQDAKRKSDLTQLKRALEIYYQDNGKYPSSSGAYKITDVSEKNWGTSWSPYISILPQDPASGNTYVYYTPNNGSCANYQCYYIFANLQRGGSDTQACFPPSSATPGAACTNAALYSLSNSCGATCNYGISSPNTTP